MENNALFGMLRSAVTCAYSEGFIDPSERSELDEFVDDLEDMAKAQV